MSRSRRKSRQLNRSDTARQMRRAGKGEAGMPWPPAAAGTLNGRPLYEGHVVQTMPMGSGTMITLGVGPPDGFPRSYFCCCPHQAMELADELRAVAMEHIGQCHDPT
jgi:hypothetical protein